MQELQREGWRAFGPRVPSHPGDLEWGTSGLADPEGVWSESMALWEDPDSGELRAWTWDGGGILDWYLHPAERGPGAADLLEDALRWFLDVDRLERAHGERTRKLSVWTDDGDDQLEGMLAREGFVRDETKQLVHRAQRLREPMADPEPAHGYSVWSVGSAGDLARRVDVHRAAFEPSKMTPERYAAIMRAPTYRPGLDVVAVAPDGAFAAFCLAWYDPQIRVGLFEPVGTHPDHRRRGLAAAVCREALQRLAALGAEWALISAWNAEEVPNHLYASLGFEETFRSHLWRRDETDR